MTKMSIVLAAVITLTTAGCKKKDAGAGEGSGSAGSSTTTTVGSGSGSAAVAPTNGGGGGGGGDCAAAIANSMKVSEAEMSKMPDYAALKDKMRDVGVQHCTDDKWPAEAIKCMTDAKTITDAQGCYGKLSPEQADKMNKAAAALMTPPAGSGSGSGSGK